MAGLSEHSWDTSNSYKSFKKKKKESSSTWEINLNTF